MNSEVSPRPNRNRWTALLRNWHSWGGTVLSAFILTVAVTGLLINHKNLFFAHDTHASGVLSTNTDVNSLPVTLEQAMQIARKFLNEVPLKKIELKEESGSLLYVIAPGGGKEIRIDAQTGRVLSKYRTADTSIKGGQWRWDKIIEDIHTGKIAGFLGKLLVDLTSLVMVALTLTGLYLWGMPKLRRWQLRNNKYNNALSHAIGESPSPLGVAPAPCEQRPHDRGTERVPRRLTAEEVVQAVRAAHRRN